MSAEDTAAAGLRSGRDSHRKPEAGQDLPEFTLPDLGPFQQILESAQDKAGAIGAVNPRAPGLVNAFVQSCKKLVARLLHWHVREQVDFNQALVRFVELTWKANTISNASLLRVAREVDFIKERQQDFRQRIDALELQGAQLSQLQNDLLRHWNEWRPAWEEKLNQAEIRLLHSIRELETASRDWDEAARKMHDEYLQALSRSNEGLQERFWKELEQLRREQEHLIHTELRLIRRRSQPVEAAAPSAESAGAPQYAEPALDERRNGAASSEFDYARFEERFRGDESYVTQSLAFYLPYFERCGRVLDIGCGRGEFLRQLTARGVSCVGVDLDPDAIAACREKGLDVEQADLFSFLSRQADHSVNGILSAHVVEHLAPGRVAELVSLAARKLSPGGVLAIETPNPNCLAIFAGDFYLDPTHQRPIPARLLDFYLQEAGLTAIEVHERHPAVEALPELAALDRIEELRGFRQKFFGGLDYAILARKPEK